MPFQELRRSKRLVTYDANGRDYLSSKLSWNRSKFEEWLYSSTVRPHLQKWHAICIENRRRYNDAVDWINTGEKGYFYNESGLEEDLLLYCLDDGNGEERVKGGEGRVDTNFLIEDIDTIDWTTQELWARAAWRIAHANRFEVHIFRESMQRSPAIAYGFVIEILCIVFHSVAFRGSGSVYLPLLKLEENIGGVTSGTSAEQGGQTSAEPHEDDIADIYTASSGSDAADHTSDATFVDPATTRSASELDTIILPGNGKATAHAEDDAASNIQVSPRKHDSIINTSSPNTAANNHKGNAETQYTLTPETSVSATGIRIFDGRQLFTSERVREWVERTF